MISYLAHIFPAKSKNKNEELDIHPLKNIILNNLIEKILVYSEKELYRTVLIIFPYQNGNKVHKVFFGFLRSLSWKSLQTRPYHT